MTTFLTVEETTIRTDVRNGKLPAKRLTGGKQVFIEERDLMGLLSDARPGETSMPKGEDIPTARPLLRMSRAQRAPYLEASALAALPIYAADLARPEAEHELTANLAPVIGSEMGKARPASPGSQCCVVMQKDHVGRLPARLVTPITPTAENGLTKPSAADALQTRPVSILRFGEKPGTLPAALGNEIAARIAICVGADDEGKEA